MTWNYRVVRRVTVVDGERTTEFGIHEAYYEKGEKKPQFITQDRTEPFGETLDELKRDLLHMAAALDKPVLDYDTREAIK